MPALKNDKLINEFNHLLAAGNIISAIPANQKLSSFLHASLTGLTGVNNCRICLYTQEEYFGYKPDDYCSACTFFKPRGVCSNKTEGKNIVFRLSTLKTNYAYITLKINDEFSRELIPAIQNLANITAISIENTLRNEILKNHNIKLKNQEEELKRKVDERTSELNLSNTELIKTVEILNEAQSIVSIGHWELDLNNNNLFWSDEVYRIFGLSKNEFIPTFNTFLEKVFHKDRELVEKTFTESIRQKKSYLIEHRIISSGKIKHVQEKGRIYYDENGNAVRAIGMVLDISERKKNEKIILNHRKALEKQNKVYEELNIALTEKNREYENLVQQLKKANKKIKKINEELVLSSEKAKESDRLKTSFLNNMSHEIRTPMNAIIGFSELLPEKLADKDKVESFVRIIAQRGNDLLRIVDDILDISKIESGLIPVNTETFNLKEFFNDLNLVFSEEKMRFGKVNLAFKIDFEESLKDINIITDKLKLRQIFYNLTGNAFKFTEKGKIEIGCKKDKKHGLIFFVNDTGPGIVKEKQEVIFNPFTQLEPDTSRFYGGTGLGLSIVKGFVKLLEGDIWIDSEPGKGCKFNFYVKHSIGKTDEQSKERELKLNQGTFLNKKVLVIEDEEYNRVLINEILAPTGLNLVFAKTGSEAMRAITKEEPDLILLDISLPDIPGYELAKALLSQNPSFKIVAQTAFAGTTDRKKALAAGCIEHLGKPLKPQVLIDTVARNLV